MAIEQLSKFFDNYNIKYTPFFLFQLQNYFSIYRKSKYSFMMLIKKKFQKYITDNSELLVFRTGI
jgi:hypothetical protein